MNTQQAARHFNVSERTILRRIKAGKLKAEQVQGRWVIRLDGQNVRHDEQTSRHDEHERVIEQLKSENTHLRELLLRHDEPFARRDEQIESLMQQLSHMQQLLAMQTKTAAVLSEQLDASRQMIEEKGHRAPLWRHIFRRSEG